MNCPIKNKENTDWLLDYSAGRLDRERASILGRHVETCPDCARFVEGQQVVWNALSQWEPQPVSSDFDRRLYRMIDQAKAESWISRLFRPLAPLWRPVVPVAAACLLIVAGVVLHTPEGAVNFVHPQARVDAIEADQVERTLDDMQMLRELALTPRQEDKTSKSM
jgi:anti-sigma factor RsiW